MRRVGRFVQSRGVYLIRFGLIENDDRARRKLLRRLNPFRYILIFGGDVARDCQVAGDYAVSDKLLDSFS